jgi:hypothetical protein
MIEGEFDPRAALSFPQQLAASEAMLRNKEAMLNFSQVTGFPLIGVEKNEPV